MREKSKALDVKVINLSHAIGSVGYLMYSPVRTTRNHSPILVTPYRRSRATKGHLE
jgi:hypothetical protein